MSEDWRPGDLAVCVLRGPIKCGRPAIHRGGNVTHSQAPLRVLAVRRGLVTNLETGLEVECGCIDLLLEDGSKGVSQRFRKVTPDKNEPCEEEFTELLNRSKQPVKAQ